MTQYREGSVEFWAHKKPDEIAIIDDSRSWTWAQINDDANKLAHGISRRGIRAGDVVATCLHIRGEWVVIGAALGKLGCSVLGLNWRLTPAEIRHVLANSGARAFFCDDADPAKVLPALDGLDIRLVVSLDSSADGFVDLRDIEMEGGPLISDGNPRRIVYTSGTTGAPKGVVMDVAAEDLDAATLQSVREYQASVAGTPPLLSDDIVLMTMPFHHGMGPRLAWTSMRSGNRIVLLRRFEPETVLRLIQQHRISVWTGVPTMYKRIAALPAETIAKYDLSSIRSLTVSAAPVSSQLREWIIGKFGPCLSETYGITETGMVAALSPEMQVQKQGSSGFPYAHVQISIRNENGERLPAGTAGEIWVKTPVTIRQYINGPLLDTDVLDPEGYFRTGDVGRVDEDGFLFITDRIKDMIVSGGVNIYPAEIEAAILRHPQVQDVAVIGVPDEEFGEQVKAFCEIKPGHNADTESIMAFCSETLASYKRPRSVDIVEELPRNTMGKLLKRELRDPFWEGKERQV